MLLYASEIVGLFNNNKNVGIDSNNDSHFISNLYSWNPLEKLNMFLELMKEQLTWPFMVNWEDSSRYPLYIDTIISLIKYWVWLCKNTCHDPLRWEAYESVNVR